MDASTGIGVEGTNIGCGWLITRVQIWRVVLAQGVSSVASSGSPV